MAEWVERMRDVDVLDVAGALGLPALPPYGRAFPCPSCGQTTRHTKSETKIESRKRGAAGTRRDRRGWRCFQCDTSGDALDLVALHLRSRRLPELSDTERADVRDWCSRYLGLDPSAPNRPTRPVAPRKAPEAAPPKYPPADELASLWERAAWRADLRDSDAYRELRAYLMGPKPDGRAWPIELVRFARGADLFRCLATSDALPGWASVSPNRRDDGSPKWPWPSAGYRMLIPAFDANAAMRSVTARYVPGESLSDFARTFGTDEHGTKRIKAPAPLGLDRTGLAYMNHAARELVTTGALPATGTVFVLEGEMDWLCLAAMSLAPAGTHAEALTGCEPHGAPVFGMFSGSWSTAIASKIPEGAIVVALPDDDKGGDVYMQRIRESFAGRRINLYRGRFS